MPGHVLANVVATLDTSSDVVRTAAHVDDALGVASEAADVVVLIASVAGVVS